MVEALQTLSISVFTFPFLLLGVSENSLLYSLHAVALGPTHMTQDKPFKVPNLITSFSLEGNIHRLWGLGLGYIFEATIQPAIPQYFVAPNILPKVVKRQNKIYPCIKALF